MRHKDTRFSFFQENALKNGVEHKNEKTSNTYSVIGDLRADDFRQSNGKFEFELIYKYEKALPEDPDEADDVLRWTQTSWLTADTVDQYHQISGHTDELSNPFSGLSRAPISSHSYLTGCKDKDNCLKNFVMTSADTGPSANRPMVLPAISGFSGKLAYSAELWIKPGNVQHSTFNNVSDSAYLFDCKACGSQENFVFDDINNNDCPNKLIIEDISRCDDKNYTGGTFC